MRTSSENEFGYMWECPDLFSLDDADVLICCPQGLTPQPERYLNRYQAGYLIGKLDYRQAAFRHGEFPRHLCPPNRSRRSPPL